MIVFSMTVPRKSTEDYKFLERLNVWCNMQGIMLIMGETDKDVTLRFSGTSQAIKDLKAYLQQR